jgi:hypothetical protein
MRLSPSAARITALAIIALAMLPCAGAIPTAAAPLAKFDLPALPDAQFDQGAWSAPAEIDGRKHRAVLAGKPGGVRLKAWWKAGSLRPPEGETAILEISYKDVLPKPAQVIAFGGIGWNFRNSPIHRFGGAADGTWKTAMIPLPWDMIVRLVSSVDASRNIPEMCQILISAEADCPIAGFTVRKAVAADETRFYAECREQIALEQADARAQNPMPAVAEPPKLDGALVAYATDPMCRVFTWNPVPVEHLGKPVRIRMCTDELEPGSFAVYANGAALTGVGYEVTALRDAAGNALKATIERRTAEYSLTDGIWVPIRLWPAYAVDIPANRSQWFLLDVETRRGEAKAGLYKGTIRITAKEGKTELPLEVEVLPVDLLTMDEAGLTMYGCYDKLPPLHDIDFARRWNFGGSLVWGNFNIPMAMRDGKLQLDFTYPDDWMQGCRKRGFTSMIWYLGGDSAGSPDTLTTLIRLGNVAGVMPSNGWSQAQAGKPFIIPEVRTVFVDWMRQVNGHAVASGWPELLPTPHDEPMKWLVKGEWIRGFFKDACAALHEADPRLRVYACMHMVDHGRQWDCFIDDIDVFNTNAVWEDPDLGDQVRGADQASRAKGGKGKQFNQYVTTYFQGSPKSMRFMFGWFFAAFGSTGCTAWAYNWDDTWDMSGKGNEAGLTAWPTAYQTIPSPWMVGQRDGLDDRRLIATYRKRFAKDAAAIAALEAILDQAKNGRDGFMSPAVSPGYLEAVEQSARLADWRNGLLDRLAGAK